MTLKEFSEQFALLAIQLRFTDADVPTMHAYYKALADVEREFVALAAQRFAQGASVNDQGQAWFPKVPEWRAMARKIERERDDELRARLRKFRDPLCRACEDTGWRPCETSPGRFVSCECRDMRRQEVLGRRPMPLLPKPTETD